ncbi:MAG: AAA family ATPase, partial [Chloroflexi bacterium]|nr:AAA family ATPase [Chloroflexota bacterium]
MEYQALYRKWRPQRFEDVVGQKHITRTLQNAIRSGNIAHAYLFCGPRGSGKTTTARLLAKALNCENGPTPEPCNECSICQAIADGRAMDIIEMDAASSTSVEDARELRETVKLAPVQAR